MQRIYNAKDNVMQWAPCIVASRTGPSAGGGVVGSPTARNLQVFSVLSPVLKRNLISDLEAVEIDGRYEDKTLGYSVDIYM